MKSKVKPGQESSDSSEIVLMEGLSEKEKYEATEKAMINILNDFAEEKKELEDSQKALLNILNDYAYEKNLSEATQKGVINILEDFTNEKSALEKTQRAVLNILDDYTVEKKLAEDTQKGIINILDDYSMEKKLSENTQKGVINILEDFIQEKNELAVTQRAVLNILDDYSYEKKTAEDTQKAVINILEDYTMEKARMETMNIELTGLNKEAEQFVYIASHDLQEPLRTVVNYIGLLHKKHKKDLDKNVVFYLDTINNATSRMQRLIKDLLEYSRVGRDKTKVAVDCNLLMEEVVNDIFQAIQESRAEIHYGLLPVVSGYYSGLKSLFQNLLSNAIKFRKSGTHPIIKINVEPTTKEYIFSIRDNGIGIEKAYYDKLFIIFQRLHQPDEYPGTGIGLAQSKKIVEMHGGKIWVESEPGKGSTFYFTIPFS